MLLADTSVWIQHFRHGEPILAKLLVEGRVLTHPFVSGELACGNLKDRVDTLSHLRALPAASLASEAEVNELMEGHRLWGRGLGWVDMHLLASARLSRCGLWTLDKKLGEAATGLGLNS